MIKNARSPERTIKSANSNGDTTRLGTGLTVRQLITRAPITVTPASTIAGAMQVMADRKIGAVIVADDARRAPVGIVTLQDVLLRIALPRTDITRPVSSVMSRDPICIDHGISVHHAALQMARRNLRHLLVTEGDGALLGIISRTDIYDMLCKSCVSIRKARSNAESS